MAVPAVPSPLPLLDVERFLDLARQVVAVGVREELRVYQLVAGQKGRSRAMLRAALASLLAKNPEQWRQLASCFEESVCVESAPRSWRRRLFERVRLALRRRLAGLTPRVRTVLVVAVILLGMGGATYRLWPRPAALPTPEEPKQPEHFYSPTKPPSSVRIIEDKLAGMVPDAVRAPVPIPPRFWMTLCSLLAGFVALGLRWLFLPRALRRWQLQSQRAAEAALAREARQRGQVLRPSYRVEPILPIARSAAEDCATLLGRLLDKERGVDLDVVRTIAATVREGGRFTPVMAPRQVGGEVLLLIDDEGHDYPWLSTVLALVDLWQRQGVRSVAYTYSNASPHFLDPYPKTHHEGIGLAEVARQHAGAALLIVSRRLSVEGFAGQTDWTQELEPFPQRAWIDPDPRPPSELPRPRVRDLNALAEHRVERFSLTDAGVSAAVRHLTSERETAGKSESSWPPLVDCKGPREQLALRLWATAAALVPDATWDQVLALRAALPEVSAVFPAPDVRYVQRLLEWVKCHGQDDPEKNRDRLYLSPDFQDQLVARLRREDSEPSRPVRFEQRVHQLLLGQLGDAPRAAEQQEGRGRLVWELKVAMHRALLHPERADELLGRFRGTGVESLLGLFLRGERRRQAAKPLFQPAMWQNLGAMVSAEGRVGARDLLFGTWRLWLRTTTVGVVLGALVALPMLVRIPKVSEWLWPQAQRVTERETPAESHVERIEPHPVVKKLSDPTPPVPPVPEKPTKVPATVQRPALIWLAPGTFRMGSAKDDSDHQDDETQHRVQLTHGFYLMETEVTQGQYKAVVGTNPAPNCSKTDVGPRLAVHCVSWLDAVQYANALSAKEGLGKCYQVSGGNVKWPAQYGCPGYRLPTEAEWEYAARAGKPYKYAGSNTIDDIAWYSGNSEGRVHDVKTRKPNGWGLYDLSGNLWEWTWDRYTDKPESLPQVDPVGSASGSDRVFRGGSWGFDAQRARVAYRGGYDPGFRGGSQGFRLARSYP